MIVLCRYVLDRVPKGAVDVILTYCHHSLNDTSLLDILPYLQEKGVGVISAAPFALGLLSGKGWPEWHLAPPELKVLHCAISISLWVYVICVIRGCVISHNTRFRFFCTCSTKKTNSWKGYCRFYTCFDTQFFICMCVRAGGMCSSNRGMQITRQEY